LYLVFFTLFFSFLFLFFPSLSSKDNNLDNSTMTSIDNISKHGCAFISNNNRRGNRRTTRGEQQEESNKRRTTRGEQQEENNKRRGRSTNPLALHTTGPRYNGTSCCVGPQEKNGDGHSATNVE
jgi:hypothetical protein